MVNFLCLWSVVWLSILQVSALEFESTGELYDQLRRTRCYTLVYVYSMGCQWCQRLNPHFDKLPSVFGEVQFARIDVRKSRKFAQEFNIESYPQLLLFGPSEGQDRSPQDLLQSVYHGDREFKAIAHYLGESTGYMPQWPQGSDNVHDLTVQSLETLQSQLNDHWRATLGLPQQPNGNAGVVVLVFVTPWMGSRHQELLLEDSPACAVDLLSDECGPGVQLWRIDSSNEHWDQLVHEFRVSSAPKIVILPQDGRDGGSLVTVDLLEYDRQVWDHELELLSQLLQATLKRDQQTLAELSQEFHSINTYGSLQELRSRIQNEQDDEIDDEDDERALQQLISRIYSM